MGYLDDLIAEREDRIARGEIPAPLPYKPHKDFGFAAAYDQAQRRIAEQEAWDSFVGKPQPVRVDENGVPIEQPQTDDGSWGVTRGLLSGGAGVLQGQAQLANLAGIGDGAAADYFGKIMQKNARKKEYTIGDMLPFASDYWTNGEGAAYDVGNMLGSSIVLGSETAAAAATGGAALGALGVGSEAAAAAAALGKSATAARAAFMTDAVVNGMGRAAAKMGMHKLEKVLTGPMGKLYAANILKTPLEASSEAGNAGAEALANGASLSDAQRQALIVGGLQMPLLALSNTMESAGLGGLFLKEAEEATGKKLGKEGFLSILGNITREGMQNAWEEGMQQSTHEYAAGKQNLLGVVNPLQWSDEAAQQAAVGAVGGAVIGGGNAGMRAYVTREQTETAPANTTAEPTPAQQAREYLDTIGQQEDKFTPEQIATLREVAENGDDETVVNTATQFGWQAPGAQQQEQGQQAQSAPVTPASTPEEQIQTATNAVNAATANVVNGGEVVGDNGGKQGTSAPVQQPTPAQQSTQEPAQTATPAVQQPSTSPLADTSATAPTNTLANTLVHDVVERLKNTEYKALVNGDGTIDTDRLRQQFNIKKFLNEHPEASAVAQAALDGDKAALTQLKKYKPEHQAAALDKAINGDDNWKYTEQELQKLENDAQTALTRNVTQIRQKMNNKIKGKKKDKTLNAEQQNELASAASSTDLGKIISTALKYGIKVPATTIAYYQENKGDGTAPVIVKNALAPKTPKNQNTGSGNVDGGKKVDNHGDNNTGGNNANTNTGGKEGEGGKADGDDGNKSGNTGGDKNVTSDVNGVDTGDKGDNSGEEVDIPKKLGDKVSDGEYKGMPRFKSEDGKVKYTLNTETNEVTRRVGNKRAEKISFNSLEEAMNFIADDKHLETQTPEMPQTLGDKKFAGEVAVGKPPSYFPTYKTEDGKVTYMINPTIKTFPVKKTVDGKDEWKNFTTLQEAMDFVANDKIKPAKGGNNNATDENRTGENGSDKGSKNPVQSKQPKEPVKAETDDNQGKGDNGEVEVDKTGEEGSDEEPSEEPTKKPVKKTTQPKAPVQKEEAVALDKVLEKYKGNADDRGIIKVLSGISKKDAPVAKQHNSIAIKKLADDIMQKYNDGELSLEEAHAQLRNLNGAYSNHSGVFAEVDGVNGKKYLAELVKKLKSEIDNAATTAKKNRADALSNAVKNSQNLIQEFKENKRNFDDTLKSIEKLKNDIIAEFDKLGVKKLGVAERKSIYDEPIKEIGKLQKEKEREQQQSTTPQELEGPQTSTDNENKNKAKETSESNQKKLTPAEAVAEKLDGLKKLEEEIQDIFDEETGELNVPKSMGLQSRADKLSVSEDDFSNAQTELILAAKAKFKAAFNLALAQGKADAAGIAVDSKEKPSATEVSDAVSGFIDTSTLENDADARGKAQNIILKSFTDEQQKILGNFDLASITEELLNVYDDKDETNAFINEKTADVDSEAADLIGQYISRMKNAYVKADNIYGLQDDYDQKAAKIAGLQKGKYSVRIGDKLGEAMYQAAWHGTPHIIEGNLTTERIGSGEGAILHGWGLYFAKARSTAQANYRERLRERDYVGEVTIRNPETGETFSWNLEESEKLFEEYDDKDYLSSEMIDTLEAFKEKDGDIRAALDLLSWRRKNALATIERWENTFPASDEEVDAYKKAEEDFYNDDIDIFAPDWSDKLKAKMRHEPVPAYSAEEIEEHLLAAKEDYKELESAERIAKSIDTSKTKEGGELLKVTLPENDVLLDEQKMFEEQPFRVKQALRRIFSALPVGNSSTEMESALESAKHLKSGNEKAFAELEQELKEAIDEYNNSALERSDKSALCKRMEESVEHFVEKSTSEIGKNDNPPGLNEDRPFDDGFYDIWADDGLQDAKDFYVGLIASHLKDESNFENKIMANPWSKEKKVIDLSRKLAGASGRSIYGMLARILSGIKDLSDRDVSWGMAKLASKELNKHGVKGIRYIGTTDGECFVIFDDDAIAIKQRYDAALRKHQEEIQRSRNEVVDKIKSMFSGSKFEEQENGDLLITTKGGNKILYKITDRIVLNGAEAQEARKAHGIADDAEVSAEGRYRTVYEGDIDAMVEVGLDSRKNTEAHETTHAVINLALGEEGSKPLFERAEKLIKEYGLKADKEEVACDAVRDFITARENGFITTFTASERAELSKTFWGRMMLRANEMGAKAKVLSDKNEAELSKTAWGKMLLAKLKLQRHFAKLLSKIYDFYKKFRAARDANENFHNLARKIELGEVWGEKSEGSGENNKYQAKPKLDEDAEQRLQADSERFGKMVDEWTKNPQQWFDEHKSQTIDFMSQTPLVLTLAGAKQLPLKMTAGFFGHSAKSKHPGMSPAVLKQIPKAIAEPLMILKDFESVNGERKEFPNKKILVLGIKNEYGATVILPVKIEANDNERYIKMNLIQNAFGVGNKKPRYQYFVDALENNEVLYIDDKKSLVWAKGAKDTRADTLTALVRKQASDDSVLHKQDLVNARKENVGKYSARPRKGKDFTISSINLKYKKELEQAFERNANAGDIIAIQNRHQEELAQYLKDKGEKQKEKAKLRAAELRELRKKLKAGEIDSFEMAGGRVTLDKDGKEKFESIQDPNELPSFVYKNNQHNDEAYKNATAIQKLNASIKRPEEKGVIQSTKDWLKDAKDKFYKQWVDKYDALGILDKAIAKKGGKPADNSMTILSQMQMVTNYATGAARALVEGDENSLKPLAQKWSIKGNTSLGMMMEKLEADHKSGKYKDYIKKSSINGGTGAQDYVNALENYLTALTLWESAQNHKLDYDREVAEWQKKGARGEKPKETPYKFPNNLTEDDIKQIIRSAPAEFKGYQKMFKSVTDDLLNIMLKSGLITLDRYDTLKDRYKFYCPLYRDFSDTAAVDDLVTQINAGRGLGNVSDPLKSRSSEGSFRDVSAPLTNAVKSISAICAKAERNRVGQYAVKEAKKHKLDEFIREVKGNAGDAKNCIFTVMFNGEKHAYQTVPELYPAITAAVEPLCKIQMAVLTKPAQLLRAGSTMSPSFIIRNFLRDTIFAAVSSKNGFIPIYDSIRGGYAYLKNKQLRGEYDAAGVVSSNYYSDNEAVTKSLNEMAGGKTWQEMTPLDIAKAFVKKPVAGLEWLSELIENSTRMGEFMKARAKGKSIEQAGHDAVEVSLNFNRSGATGQQINRMVPFFNACIQGGDKMYRLFKANPRDTALKIAIFIVLPSLALWVYNHDEDWYKDIDPNIKMTNWIVGGLRIPKPQEAGILFGSGLEAMLDTANGQDPKAMKEWRHNVIEALTPGFLPTVILPIIEWMANYSFFRDKPVVSQALQRLPDEMQYGPYTSETAKGIGSITGLSPVKIDNLWRGYTGTMGMFLFQAPDLFAAEKQNLPEKKVSEMTVVRDFIVNDMNMNRTMNEFYELKNAATQKHAGYGKKGKPSAEVAGVNIAAQSIQKLQKEARDITASSKYNSAQKRVLIDKLQAKQKKIAQACIKKYGSKFDY